MMRVDPKLNSVEVVDARADPFILHDQPKFVRLHNCSNFIAERVRIWIIAITAEH